MNRLVTASGLSDDSDFAKMLVRNMKVASVGGEPACYRTAADSVSACGQFTLHEISAESCGIQENRQGNHLQIRPDCALEKLGQLRNGYGQTMYEQMIAPTKAARTKELLMAGAGWADEVTWSRLGTPAYWKQRTSTRVRRRKKSTRLPEKDSGRL